MALRWGENMPVTVWLIASDTPEDDPVEMEELQET
jgi:hypothetical protein